MAEILYPLTIAEIDGSNRLDLGESSMPAQGVAMPIELRRTSTYYPGVSAPSTQIMGTKEGDITLRGVWRDSWLSETDGAQALVAAARALVLGQRRCQLEWNDLVRRGYVHSFTPTVLRRDLVTWELVFFPDQADEAIVVATPAVPLPTNFGFANALAAALLVADEIATVAISANNVLRAVA